MNVGFVTKRQIREALSREDAALLRRLMERAIQTGEIGGDIANFLLQKLRRLEK